MITDFLTGTRYLEEVGQSPTSEFLKWPRHTSQPGSLGRTACNTTWESLPGQFLPPHFKCVGVGVPLAKIRSQTLWDQSSVL